MTPTTLRFAYKAFLGLSQDRAANAAHAGRKRLPTVASQDCKRESQPTPGCSGSPRKKKKRGGGSGQASKHRFFPPPFLFQFLRLTGALPDPPTPRLGVAGVEPAPVTSLGSRSPTRPTPVKPQPGPLRDALTVAREPGTLSRRRRPPPRGDEGHRGLPGDPGRSS